LKRLATELSIVAGFAAWNWGSIITKGVAFAGECQGRKEEGRKFCVFLE
jgi:hypothetical protein